LVSVEEMRSAGLVVAAIAPPRASIRVVIAGDQPIVQEGLTYLLDAIDGFEPVGSVSTVEELLRAVRDHEPDVVLLNMRIGGEDSLLASQRIKLRHPNVGVLLFPNEVADEQAYRALASGVDGIVLTNAPVPEVLTAISTVARGDVVVGRDLCARAGGARLSVREHEVVRLMADGMSNRDISRNLCISIGTTKRHVENIARKFGTSTRAAAAAEALRRGLVA
jgi:DNA-binding NarL/FixJ family response regulator